ncbi:TCR/Tet family MFS transporter [Parasphingorhabdus halotolerans]|uniref:TCR/Tet family MFS transporter n=1 Tax=Parasphingorhabdus halotolerans TaxID=2725558 RepID=A0A6H2DQ69_9SPHN|nr:TCR/Tet family MFS transporter [Parasphingorhabdus halotolerans]QJB70484.1 TCR/Tet family MFS transporter [Parasphingorhabdus halotolerans]
MTDSTSPQPAKASLLFVILVVMIDMIGFGVIMPVFPELLVEITGDTVAEASIDAGWLAFTYAAMQFVFSPIIGNLSDKFGRRPVLLATLAGYAISYMLMGLAPTLLWIFVGRVLTGIMGASFSVANAYIADVSPPDKRAANFGLIGMAFGVGFIIGPALGGFLGEIGTRVPFFFAGGLALLNLVFGFFMLKESLPKEKRRTFNIKRANAFVAMKGLSQQNRVVLWYAITIAVWMLAHMVYPIMFAFYAVEALQWSPKMIGFALAMVGLGAAVVQGGLIRVIIPKVGERNAVIIGVFGMVIGTLFYPFAREYPWLVFVALVPGALQGLVQPSVNGLMSKAVSDTTQGELQGAVSSLSSISTMISPLLYPAIFFAFTARDGLPYFPAVPFVVAGAIALVALAIFLRGYALHNSGEIVPEPDAQTT